MNKFTLLLATSLLFLSCGLSHKAQKEGAVIENESYYRDLYSDTWVATDGVGREMPDYEEVGPVKKDQRRVVGIFYITWHTQNLANQRQPYEADVTKILAKDPTARFKADHPLWYTGSYHWGEPEMGSTLKHPSYCEGTNIVHYNTNNTDIKLAGETKGCGLLLVEGNLEINGDFSWNGMVIVSGSVICLGGGDKNVTGALLVGGEFDADIVGGNTNIIYCSSANNKQTESLPWRVLSWKEHF